MNSIDRPNLASSLAAFLFLLLVYGFAGRLDRVGAQGMERARKPIPLRLLCETADDPVSTDRPAPRVIRLVILHMPQPEPPVILHCESFEP